MFDGVTETTEDVRQLVEQVTVIRTLSSILVYVCGHGPAVDDVGRNDFLIRAYGRDDPHRTPVDLLATVADDANYYHQTSLLQVLLRPRLHK